MIRPWLVKIVFALLLLFFFSPSTIAQDALPKLVKTIQPAVVTVFAYDSEGKLNRQGSGFFINQEGQFITNCHVLEGASRAEVKTFLGNRYQVKGILAEDQNRDLILAIISPEVRPPPGPPPSECKPGHLFDSVPMARKADQKIDHTDSLRFSGTLPEIGERVVVVGSPMGLEQTLSEGVVSAIRQTEEFGEILQITAPISPGSSGSPVVNMKGEVVGIATFLLKEGQNLNFAIPGSQALALKPGELKPMAQSGLTQKTRFFKNATPEALVIWYKGAQFYEAKKYLAAIDAFKIAIKLSPKFYEAFIGLGKSYGGLNRYKEAVEAYEQAIHLEPDNAWAYRGLGIGYMNLGKLKEAVATLKQAIRLDPDSAQAFCNLGSAYSRLCYNKEAIEAYKQAISLDPDDPIAHLNLGLHYCDNLGDKSAALEEYKFLKGLDPKLAKFLFNSIYR
jgi:tetratricopeptide (TPR) repeat protein